METLLAMQYLSPHVCIQLTCMLSITQETERNEKLLVSLSRTKVEKSLVEESLSKV